MLKLNEIIYIAVISIVVIFYKGVKYGKNKEQLKEYKKNEKLNQKRRKIKPVNFIKHLLKILRKGRF